MTVDAHNELTKQEKEADYSRIWESKPFEAEDYWYLETGTLSKIQFICDLIICSTEQAEDAYDTLMVDPKSLQTKFSEICLASISSIVITLEAGVGKKTIPMLLLEMGFQGEVKNWSSQLAIETSLTIQMGYYNSHLALWEPLVEPVLVTENNVEKYVPWEIRAIVGY